MEASCPRRLPVHTPATINVRDPKNAFFVAAHSRADYAERKAQPRRASAAGYVARRTPGVGWRASLAHRFVFIQQVSAERSSQIITNRYIGIGPAAAEEYEMIPSAARMKLAPRKSSVA